MQLLISGGQEIDFKSAPELIEKSKVAGCYVICDKRYSSSKIVSEIEEAGGVAVIPSKSNSRKPREYDKEMYKCRNQYREIFQPDETISSICNPL